MASRSCRRSERSIKSRAELFQENVESVASKPVGSCSKDPERVGMPPQKKIKGPENPTSQLLPIMSKKGCSGDREGRKNKGGGGGKMVCDKVVCEKWCVKDGL